MSDDAETIIREQAQLEGAQAQFRRWWEEIAYHVIPAQATFISQPTEGQRRTERLFDSTAVMSNERFAAALEQMLTPRTQEWHGLAPADKDLTDDQEVKEYLDKVTKILFAIRYRPRANFASQAHEGYMSIGAFGNTALYIDEDVGSGVRYRAIPMQESVWATDHQGRVDTFYRKYKLQARQAVQRFKNATPEIVRNAIAQDPFKEFEFIHCTRPNADRIARLPGYRGMAHASFYVSVDSKSVIEVGGYRAFPYAVGRYSIAPRENYGRSPAMACWSAIKTLNEEKKTVLRAGQKAVDPPWLLYEEGVLEAFDQRSGAANYGMLTADGTPLAQPAPSNANIPLGIELMGIEKSEINDAFLVSLFQILVENPTMTATEALIRAQEKGTMLAPAMGRLQSEYLGTLIEAEIDIAGHAGLLPPPPRQLIERGAGYKIEYKSQLSRAMRAGEGAAIMNTIQAAGQIAAVKPDVMDVIDLEGAVRELADINGMPAKLMVEPEKLAQIRANQAQAVQAQNMMEGAPQLSVAAKNFAQAQQATAAAANP